jgi:hypothetical protein
MDQAHYYLNEILDFFRTGFEHVNALLGLIISLIAAAKLSAWRGLWEIALIAMLVHIIAMVVLTSPIRLPPLFNYSFWHDVVALYVGYVIIIAVFYFLKIRLVKHG